MSGTVLNRRAAVTAAAGAIVSGVTGGALRGCSAAASSIPPRREVIVQVEGARTLSEARNRPVEIACVELVGLRKTGRTFWSYVNPEDSLDRQEADTHGLSDAFLATKPRFSEVAQEIRRFLDGSQVVAYFLGLNLGLLNAEFERCGVSQIPDRPTMSVWMLNELIAGDESEGMKALSEELPSAISSLEPETALAAANLIADIYPRLVEAAPRRFGMIHAIRPAS